MSGEDCTTTATAGRDWSVNGETSLQSIVEQPDCPDLIRDTLAREFSWQVRVETLVRRALASPQHAPSFVAVLLALGADVTLGAGQAAMRDALLDLVEGRVKGRVHSIYVPVCRGQRYCGQAIVARTPADEPIVAAYAVVEKEGEAVCQARVALTGVWAEPARLASAPKRLIGRRGEPRDVAEVAALVAGEVSPRGDFLGSVEYRRAMAEVLTRRALGQCQAGAWRSQGRI